MKDGVEKEKKIKLKFIDRFRFMASSLDNLSKILNDNQCKSLRKEFDDHHISN